MPGLELPFSILAAVRTPLGAFGGSLRTLGALPMAQAVLRELANQIHDGAFSAIGLGCAVPEGLGPDPGSQIAQASGLMGPAWMLNQGRSSGLMALDLICRGLDGEEQALAGAFESLSLAPYLLPSARWGRRMGETDLIDPLISQGLPTQGELPVLPPPLPLEIPSRKGPLWVSQDDVLADPNGFWADGAVGLVISRKPTPSNLARLSKIRRTKNIDEALWVTPDLVAVSEGLEAPNELPSLVAEGLPPAPSGLLLLLALLQGLQTRGLKRGLALQPDSEGQVLALMMELP